ncbi:MAG TPA: HEAT repeat domain-containing protein [Vicinamibacterales bacterium]|nr:HEAT repeat domain-containing protein [Vicinamibacterales bacterium]
MTVRLTCGARAAVVVAAVLAAGAAGFVPAARAVPQQPQTAQSPLLEQMRAEARTVMTAAAAAGRAGEAFDTYDRFYASVKAHDAALLTLLAKAVLTEASGDPASLARIPALERLARGGDARARGSLDAAAGGRNTLMPAGIEADVALARLGDARAVDRLTARLADETLRDKGQIIGGLMEAGAKRSASALVPFLSDENPTNRLSAVQALARVGSREQVPALRAAFEAERHAGMRQTMAMALHSLGSDAGDAMLAEIASSRFPDVRLMALEAHYATKSPAWTGLARQLLRSSSEGARLRAAVMLGLTDADAARELTQAASSSNVATREVGARLLEAAGSRDLALLLKLMRDPSPIVRTHAAGAVLARGQ